jgi:hypothetical protein
VLPVKYELNFRLCGLVVRVPDYITEMYCISCEVRTEFIYVMLKKLDLLTPCGGGLEYLHRCPASRKRRHKGNPVPGGITGPPCPGGYKYGNLALQVGGVSNETVKYGREF